MAERTKMCDHVIISALPWSLWYTPLWNFPYRDYPLWSEPHWGHLGIKLEREQGLITETKKQQDFE